jgi:Cdc6-like AAA superfamily ATPase
MQFPDTEATRITEKIIAKAKQNLTVHKTPAMSEPLTVWQSNRIYEAAFEVLTAWFEENEIVPAP